MEIARLVERSQPGPGGLVRGVAQLQRARDLHLADPDPGTGHGTDDVSGILERDRLVAQVVADAEMRVDQLTLGPGRLGQRTLEEPDDVGRELQRATRLGLQADADAPTAAVGTGPKLAGHSDQRARRRSHVLGRPADPPAQRQA